MGKERRKRNFDPECSITPPAHAYHKTQSIHDQQMLFRKPLKLITRFA